MYLYYIFFCFVSRTLRSIHTSQQYSDGVKYIFCFIIASPIRFHLRMPFVLFVSINGTTEQRIKSMFVDSNVIISTANTKSNTSILWKPFNRIEKNYYRSSEDHSISSSFAQNIYSTHFLNQFIYRPNIVYRTQFSATFSFCAINRTLQNGKMKDLTVNNLIQNNNVILKQKNGYTNGHITDR